jgi:hypothetical protein
VDFLAAVRAEGRGREIFTDSDSGVRHAGMWHFEAPTAITAGARGWKRPATASGRDVCKCRRLTGSLDAGVSAGELDSARRLGERVARLAVKMKRAEAAPREAR